MWEQIKNNWLIQATSRAVFFLNAASVICIAARLTSLPPLVPLWYSRPWGADQLTHPLWLFILPAGSMALYVVNRAIGVYLTAEYLIFTQMAFLTSLLVSLLSFIAVVKILFLVS